eukprot:6198581-Pleurochrysis_carterae.AAC.1
MQKRLGQTAVAPQRMLTTAPQTAHSVQWESKRVRTPCDTSRAHQHTRAHGRALQPREFRAHGGYVPRKCATRVRVRAQPRVRAHRSKSVVLALVE